MKTYSNGENLETYPQNSVWRAVSREVIINSSLTLHKMASVSGDDGMMVLYMLHIYTRITIYSTTTQFQATNLLSGRRDD